ncbi:MAG: membrane protein insertase YidC [Sphingomonadales bacterium]
MSEQKNLLIALGLSAAVLLGWEYFYAGPQRAAFEAEQAEQAAQAPTEVAAPPQAGDVAPAEIEVAAESASLVSREEALADDARVIIDTPRLSGSINLNGGHFDDLTLKDYWVSVEQEENVHLLSPLDGPAGYTTEFGWLPRPDAELTLPDADTRWSADKPRLKVGEDVTLSWSNGQGLVFKRRISVDENYLFTIAQTIENTTDKAVTLYPFAKITRRGLPDTRRFFVLHEGAVGVIDGSLEEVKYSKMEDEKVIDMTSTGGWIGMTDQYWMTALVPDQNKPFSARLLYRDGNLGDYVVSYREDGQTIPAGGSIDVSNEFFAGAKEVDVVEAYEADHGIEKFDLTIDWGWFRFLTKPIFYGLDFFNGVLGNVGLAILALTLIIKLMLFPVANKSYESMGRMKKIQPRMKELQERYKDDRMRLQQEMSALFKKEKVNPMMGCLPIVVQIPVFFSLYKVLFVTIEMRHAPFFGWIKDLSAPDPMTPINLFGLLPFDPPGFLAIGILPIIMGVTMWLQQKLNPAPQDPIQAQVMKALPIVFTFIMAPFAAGLVVYWTWNNLLSITQQWVIQRRVAAQG